MPSNQLKEYVVVIRAGSRLRFNPDEFLRINVNNEWGGLVLTIQTRYVDEGYESEVPRELWIEARGPAPSLDMAAEAFTNSAIFFTTIISFCANGYAGECNFHLAFDDTPGESEREYFTQFLEDERGLPRLSRRINVDLTLAVINALDRNKETERLRRAIVQYVLGLRYWRLGNEILATAHLYMGMEALAKAVTRAIQEALGVSDIKFAQYLDINIDSTPSRKLKSDIVTAVRRNILFQGDAKCHKDAKEASDGIEHGYLSYAEIRPLAEQVRDKTAEYLRYAIIQQLEFSIDTEQKLTSPPYDKPFGTTGYVRYLRGTLKSDSDELAQSDEVYPTMKWSFSAKTFALDPGNEYTVSFSQTITPRLGEGVAFQPKSAEIYGPEGVIVTGSPYQGDVEPKIIKQDPNEVQRKKILSTLDKIGDRIKAYSDNQIVTPGYEEALMLLMYSRCRSLFDAVKALLLRKLPEEALILGGSLFIETIRLILLASTNENRSAMTLGLANELLDQKLKMFQDAFDAGLEEDIDNIREQIESQRNNLYQQASESGVGELASVDIEQQMMVDLSSPDCYGAYLLSTQMTIGSTIAYHNRLRQSEDNQYRVETVTEDIAILGTTAGFASETLLLATQAAGHIFNWPELEDLQDLLHEARELYNFTHVINDEPVDEEE